MTDMPSALRRSKIVKKTTVEVELVMNDGDLVSGEVFVQPGERVQDLLNNELAFMPLRLANQEIVIIRKAAIAVCKPLDIPG